MYNISPIGKAKRVCDALFDSCTQVPTKLKKSVTLWVGKPSVKGIPSFSAGAQQTFFSGSGNVHLTYWNGQRVCDALFESYTHVPTKLKKSVSL
jgi:hypothetical protein